jgi:hypothetical protein
MKAALGRSVDLTILNMILNRAPVDFVDRVLRDGILVCERDRSKRIWIEVRARNQYFDLLPYRVKQRLCGCNLLINRYSLSHPEVIQYQISAHTTPSYPHLGSICGLRAHFLASK